MKQKKCINLWNNIAESNPSFPKSGNQKMEDLVKISPNIVTIF